MRAAWLIVLCVVAGTAGCRTYSSTRSRELSSRVVEELGPLKSDKPVESTVESASLDVVGLEASSDPALAVKVTTTRRLSYEVTVVGRRIAHVRYARADYVVRDIWLNHTLRAGLFVGIIIFPVLAILDVTYPPYAWSVAFRHAGEALESGDTAVVDALKDEQDAACIVTVAERDEVDDPEPTGKTERLSKTVTGPEAGAEVEAGFAGVSDHAKVTTGADGIARVPIADLALLRPAGAAAPTLVVAALGQVLRLDLSDAQHRRIRDALVPPPAPEPPAGPPPVGSPELSDGDRKLLEAGREAERRGDFAAAVKSYGTLVAFEPRAAAELGLRRDVPRLLRALGASPLVPAAATDAVTRGAAALAGAKAAEARDLAEDAIAAAPWWSGGHELLAAAHDLLGEREAAARALAVAVALAAEGSPEARALTEKLARSMREGAGGGKQ